MKLVRSCTRHPLLQYPADVTRLTTNTHTHACVNMRARTHTHICVHHIPLTSTSVFLAKTLISRTFYSSQTRTQNDMYTCSAPFSLALSLSLTHTHTHIYIRVFVFFSHPDIHTFAFFTQPGHTKNMSSSYTQKQSS